MVVLVDRAGTEIARAFESDSSPMVLDYILGYQLGWNVGCDAHPPAGTVARVSISAAATVDLPLGAFGPSCVDGSNGALFMFADDRG
jgi:hypothetical protein